MKDVIVALLGCMMIGSVAWAELTLEEAVAIYERHGGHVITKELYNYFICVIDDNNEKLVFISIIIVWKTNGHV
ncbi:MAG: hypothetical protein GDA36_12740 [Rhodobacteraceae bacterium]|nr:hypothetical protein [Paracoccaceae bacterium]